MYTISSSQGVYTCIQYRQLREDPWACIHVYILQGLCEIFSGCLCLCKSRKHLEKFSKSKVVSKVESRKRFEKSKAPPKVEGA